MVFTYLVGVQTSLERHFHFSSKQTGLLPSLGELGPLLSAVLLSYLASHGNRPRWMGIGMFMVTIGMLVGFASYLVFPYPEIRDNTVASRRLCRQPALALLPPGQPGQLYGTAANATAGGAECTIDVSSSNAAYFLWALVYVLVASGSQTIYIVSAPYMDDGVSQRNSPLFFALAGIARILGPIMGYMLASACISVYVDPNIDPGITKRDQRWIGAWWIGLLVIAGLLTLYGWLISLFPRHLSRDHLPAAERRRLVASDASQRPSRQEFVNRALRLLKNPVLMACIMSNFFFLMSIIGFYAYQPKYLEHHFRVNKATATTYSAVSKVTLVFGILGSGLLMRRFRPSGRLVSGLIVAFRVVGAFVFLTNFFFYCNFGDDLPGIRGPNGSLDISSECSTSCGCTTEEYIPVCHRSGEASRSYFSPCHAGCTTAINGTNSTNNHTAYTDCRCLDDVGATLASGLCQGGCEHAFHWFLIMVAISGMIKSAVSIPHVIIVLRCVLPEDKAMAMGLSGALVAISFGAGPLIMGSLVDHACLVWEQSCGHTGACWVYDPDMLRYSIVGFVFTTQLLSALSDVFVFLNAKSLNLYPDEEEEEADGKGKGTELEQKKPAVE
ncbi:solute carrier organic anion transporter family member 74D-like [Pollicipes pollicipes]|uniref:solute carrier organic anion transporter family member 74D-like n=1 Tax=Pollicipes pollicipes TaxID=41117 RepID=UPI001884B31F|nr:solute carrier organic anion transporter family member 74D-like [Pollicipes pollicipes]